MQASHGRGQRAAPQGSPPWDLSSGAQASCSDPRSAQRVTCSMVPSGLINPCGNCHLEHSLHAVRKSSCLATWGTWIGASAELSAECSQRRGPADTMWNRRSHQSQGCEKQ